MFSRIGSAAIKKDLTNTLKICEAIGNPQNRFRSIHIAGTNGKGSVSHMLAAVLQTAGYKTGLYTSPHLYDFRERIKVNGNMAEQDFIIAFVEKVKPIIEEIEPSFFEITVAMAFEYFATQNVDVAIIETGLGGRLDSTNIIKPVLSVITNIGYDHMNILGNSLHEIAGEKAGIIKEGTPVVIGEKRPDTAFVFEETAKSKSANLTFAEDVFTVLDYKLHPAFIQLQIENQTTKHQYQFQLDLPGIYQTKNATTVLAAIKLLKENGWNISDDIVRSALGRVKALTGLYGRWEVLQEQPLVVLEVAHNTDGLQQMLQHIDQLSFSKLHLVLGMVKDKEIKKVLELLPSEAQYYFTQAAIPRALDKEQLKAEAARFDLNGAVHEDINEAIETALKMASNDDLIVVCGSIFLVAEVDRARFKKNDI